MKKLLIPAVLAVVLGLGAGSAFSYKNAKEAAKVFAAHVADSVAKHVKDSTTAADSVAKDEQARELAAAAEEIPLTPADSIRLAQNQPTTLSAATNGLPNATDPKHEAPASKTSRAPAATADHGAPSKPPAAAPKAAAAGTRPGTAPAKTTPKVATATTPEHAAEETHAPDNKAPAALEGALPERRIAKIFGAMQSKDAAKVLEQMTDSDVRVILGMMGDKQAAAILTALPAARAAAISKGTLAKDEKKPNGGQP